MNAFGSSFDKRLALRQERRARPCFSLFHLPIPNSLRPVLSSRTCKGPGGRTYGWQLANVHPRRLKVAVLHGSGGGSVGSEVWFDALGLALFAVTGAERALLAGSGPVVAVAMGVITATFGGVIRDVLGNESPVVLSREVYVTAALVGAAVFRVVLSRFGFGRESALGAGLFVGLVVRGMALRQGWSLPRYRERPGRTLDEIKRPD